MFFFNIYICFVLANTLPDVFYINLLQYPNIKKVCCCLYPLCDTYGFCVWFPFKLFCCLHLFL